MSRLASQAHPVSESPQKPLWRPELTFEVCHELYEHFQIVLENRVSTIRLDEHPKDLWHPDRLPKVSEYVADFALVGRRALSRPMWKRRLKLFEVYFLQGMPYKRAIALVGVPEGTFNWWVDEIKRHVGRELKRAGLFPPRRYFREPTNGIAVPEK